MKQSFVSPIFARLAKKIGIVIHLEPDYGYAGQIILPNGEKRYFRGSNLDLNPLGASEIAKDKGYAGYFLDKMGYPVPFGKVFFSDRWCAIIGSRRNPEAAYRYARRLGFPVIVKPNSKSQGYGVAKIFNGREFFQAVRFICRRENVFLVQRIAKGRDYRLVILDNKIISAYERLPLAVMGDGKHSIIQLLKKKQNEFHRQGRETVINPEDFRILTKLRRLKLSLKSKPAQGEKVVLLDNANLSTGGEAKDVTKILHHNWRKIAVQITRDMGLRFCGVDLMINGEIASFPSEYVVLEINASPGLDHYASIGKPQRKIVERLYLKVLKALCKV